VASAGLPEMLDNLARGRFAGRFITRLPRVLTLVVDLGLGDVMGVDLPGAIGVTPADGSDAVQYRLVSVVLQQLGARGHCTSRTVALAVDDTSMWHNRDDHVATKVAGDGYGGFAGRGRIAFYVRDFILE
jgi:hypothetical protein